MLQRVDSPGTLEPRGIAALYRRSKGDRGEQDEPALPENSIYGEMEMRRHAAPRISGERFLLTLYWAVSGICGCSHRALVVLVLLSS